LTRGQSTVKRHIPVVPGALIIDQGPDRISPVRGRNPNAEEVAPRRLVGRYDGQLLRRDRLARAARCGRGPGRGREDKDQAVRIYHRGVAARGTARVTGWVGYRRG